jgi:flagellar biosynthetic protein FlhB
MSESSGEDRTLDASARKLADARRRGDLPSAREAASAGVVVAGLLGLILTGGLLVRRLIILLLPMFDQPDAFGAATAHGWQAASGQVATALALAIVPFLLLVLAGSLLPYVLQGAVAFAPERLAPRLAHLSPAGGLRRMFGLRALVEFAKSLAKACGIGFTCWIIMRPFLGQAIGLTAADFAAFPAMLQDALMRLLLAAALMGLLVAGIDAPYQLWSWRRRLRMTVQEMREETRSNDGDPQVKGRLRRLRRQRARRRMMQRVRHATVVVTNPTHVAVALLYRRGREAAPLVVAKGADLVAQRIREVAREHAVPVVENPPLARALHEAVEIDEMIPREHFEAVAKIIGVIWAQRGRRAGGAVQ